MSRDNNVCVDKNESGAQHTREKRVLSRSDEHNATCTSPHTLTTTKAPVEAKVHTASKNMGLLMVRLSRRKCSGPKNKNKAATR